MITPIVWKQEYNRNMIIFLILMGFFIFYGISISYKNSGTHFYLIWFVFALISLFLYFHLFDIPVFLFYLAGFCVLTGLVLVACVLSQCKAKVSGSVDYVLILGAQYKKNGPSKALKYRLDAAIAYCKAHPDTVCIVSGGQGYNEPCSEAYGMEQYLKKNGIHNKILLEDTSTSTLENIVFSKKYIDTYMKGAIVTNSFHMYRALKIARKQGLNVQGISARASLWYQPNNVLREVFGIVKDKCKGNM